MWRISVAFLTALAGTVLLISACSTTGKSAEAKAADRGEALVREFGCAGCHAKDETDGLGPGWGNIWGTERALEDGRSVLVDREYLRRSVADPGAEIVQGFLPRMPLFPLSDEELDDISVYLQYVTGGKP